MGIWYSVVSDKLKVSIFLAISRDVGRHSSKRVVGNVIFIVKLFRWDTFITIKHDWDWWRGYSKYDCICRGNPLCLHKGKHFGCEVVLMTFAWLVFNNTLFMQSYIRVILILKCHKRSWKLTCSPAIGNCSSSTVLKNRRYQVSATWNEGYICGFFWFCKSNLEPRSYFVGFNS